MKKHKFYYREKLKYCFKKKFTLLLLKVVRDNILLSKLLRERIINSLTKKNTFFNLNKLKKFCVITGRLRFIINQTKFSRMIFREFSSKGFIFGITKNS